MHEGHPDGLRDVVSHTVPPMPFSVECQLVSCAVLFVTRCAPLDLFVAKQERNWFSS